ncbi:MAG: AAA family ATPase [Minisyncoccia bacterium]|jgi:DNA polymerase III gamma/tau subunit
MDLFGHEERTRAFQKLIRENKLGQAYLFYGDRGVGKGTFARLLAYALENGKFEVATEPLLDASFVLKGEEKNSIGIEKILEVRKFLWQKPLKSPRRLAVIDNAEELTPEAQGALLKIVEEPPEHALLIFVAHDPQVLIPPLLSRFAKVYFPRLSKNEVAKILKEKYGESEKKARDIAAASFGRIGYALELLKLDPKGEDDLEDFLERSILKLWRENLEKNASLLSWLLDRETLVKRYNLNMNLQRKAAEEMLKN